MAQKNGGPAFPMPGLSGLPNEQFIYGENGMTLRDYFAAKALQGLCANPGGPFQHSPATGWGLTNCTLDDVSSLAVNLADSLIAELNK